MTCEIVLPPSMKAALREHLLGDRSKEQMAIVLCGLSRSAGRIRLLGRHAIRMSKEAFAHQSVSGLEIRQSVQREVLELAAREKLSQVDFHTHPGDGAARFSGIDDKNELTLATYIARRIPETLYASVVLNGESIAGRLWDTSSENPKAAPISPPDLNSPVLSANGAVPADGAHIAGRYDRQVRGFGAEFQSRLSRLKIGVAGVGGLGSVIVEELTRLGVANWALVDPDIVVETNLNRLLGAEEKDVREERSKVEVTRRNIRRIIPKAKVLAVRATVFAGRALKALKECDLIIASTDNHVSRLTLNALSCQFLIPLVHVGVNLETAKSGGFEDISGEVVIPSHGEWCLLCGGIIDAQRASREIAPPEEQILLVDRGYIRDTPAPAVYHLNALVASLAVAEIHNLVWPYKPLRRYLAYNELAGEMMSVQVSKSDSCLHCGPEGLLGIGDLAPIWKPNPVRTLLSRGVPSGFGDFASNQPRGADK